MKLISFLSICLMVLTGYVEQESSIAVESKEQTIEESFKESNLSIQNKIPSGSTYKQSPTFTLNEKIEGVLMLYEIRGEKGKFGFLDKPLIKGEENQLDWLLWNLDSGMVTGNLLIKGTNTETGQKVVSKGKVINKEKSIKDLPRHYKTKPLNNIHSNNLTQKDEITPASIASTSIFFLESGIWDLEVSVDKSVIGNVKVFVKDVKTSIHYLNN
ncbi:hypothetical protein ACFRCQ_16680 [Cytobacillus firmus]|uniref:hypothetical protein n=1 Tax=Cytobacillus firmus TaxID=1399 RepID=UPI003697825B